MTGIDIGGLGKLYVRAVTAEEFRLKTSNGETAILDGVTVPEDNQYLAYDEATKRIVWITLPIPLMNRYDGDIMTKSGSSINKNIRPSGVNISNVVTDTDIRGAVHNNTVPVLLDQLNKSLIRLSWNDRLPLNTITEINNSASVSLTMTDITSGIILRNSNGETVTDILPTAAQFVSFFNATYNGMTIIVTLCNSKGMIYLQGGNGLHAIGSTKVNDSTLKVDSNNQVEIKFIIRDNTIGSESVAMIITSKVFS